MTRITCTVDMSPRDADEALRALVDFVLAECGHGPAREIANALYDAQVCDVRVADAPDSGRDPA